MPAEMNDDERVAEAWLKSQGYHPEFTPAIVKEGRSPDFLARNSEPPPAVWAEVKSLEPEAVTVTMSRAWEIIRAFGLPQDLKGHGTLWVNEGTRDQSVRALLKLFSEHAEKHRGQTVKLAFIQQTADTTGIRRIDFDDGDTPIRFWIRGAGDELAAIPPGELDGFRVGKLHQRGEMQSLEAYRLFDWHAPFDCALVATLDDSRLPLSISPMGGGFVSVAARVHNALDSANGQIKNACRFLEAPGVALVMPPAFGPVDNQQIAAACYGKLSFSVAVGSPVDGPGRFGPLEHGPDAAFQSGKNRHISAAIRLNRGGTAGMFFPNPFAHRPIDRNSAPLKGVECYPPAIDL